ncbi:glycoside hydrolase/phage tail family protein [Mesorhizobium sp. YM1C-6-2]|uniref:baseplate multidomain protein megatron n=1 Tax=Mesorhizobium sp. YM1C-6-2 TaxID=1827501 RepID=UPI000EF216E0|nr:glycoside hydrolase/phage tail family protein [Mesorhizobium sp. YM1C-6-2]RLP25311.1 host specificity protein [Mesorhizobium sp. YM1C-6-2]
MATILLQAAGAAIGGLLGPIGSVIGAAAGALAGYTIDQALINGTRRIEGPRLSGARPFTAEEGAALPRVYGTARVGGIMIWATRFDEKRKTQRQGGKSGPKLTEYSYFANVAFALCEGEIAGIRRVWADGREIDRERIELRVYRGTEAQAADPLIAAKQGAGNTPAYRGTAYVAIERFALADYGNRIPQFQFEVLRPVGELPKKIRAVSLIPGATEYGLSPSLVTRKHREGETEAVNRHTLLEGSDLSASLDELQMLCPNLAHVALVVSWFGDDLRAGHCRVRPAVTTTNGSGFSRDWRVSGLSRGAAMVVSTHGDGAAYGGTPSDRSVMDAIAEIKARGLKVTLYPFIMMDVPDGNVLPDPHGNPAQPAYPWRGRITADPAPLMPGTADRTAAAREQIEDFLGNALPGQFSASSNTINFSGSAGDWRFRRFVLHHAKLAQAAGGVDAFLIGSELRGLTTLRDENDAFPFVAALCALAGEVRTMLGASTTITYGADWSEYFGHHPLDGTGNTYFHLDPLWAHPAIDAVGIDNYMPLSDWRDGDHATGNPDGFAGPYDPAGLRAAIAGGEGFDWYYPTFEARRGRERAPITDGAFGKPWMFRYKDLKSWWSEPHFNRIGGEEAAEPTGWVPESKPFFFTEVGCPATDKGPNQPNVFSDPKSAESTLPYFSSGGRSDLAQQRFLMAHQRHWDPGSDGFDETDNPVSTVDGRRMVDPERLYVWAWDARPYPAFPLRSDRWSDHGNWHYGHWLNGRLGNPDVGTLINAILADHGLPAADIDGADGTVHGYVIDEPGSARGALEPLVELFGLAVLETPGSLVFRSGAAPAAGSVEIAEMVSDGRDPVTETVRQPDHQLPAEAVLSFRDPLVEYQVISVRHARTGELGSRQHAIGFPGVLEAGQGRALIGEWLRRTWTERESVAFAMTQPNEDVVPGAVVRLPGREDDWLVTEIEDGLVRKVSARQILRAAGMQWQSANPDAIANAPPPAIGQPLALFLDLPTGAGPGAAEDQFRLAAWQKPWRSQAVFASPEDTGFTQRTTIALPADVGVLAEPLPPGVVGRRDHSVTLTIELYGGEFSSISRAQLLNGANSVAIRSTGGAWEVVQFETAEEIAPEIWRLGGLLRGQLGTDDATTAGAAAGAHLVVLDDAVQPAGLLASEAGLLLNWRVGPAGADLSGADFSDHSGIGGLRALLPLSPVHVRATKDGSGDVALSWVRRGRIDADSWTASDIPLGEEREEYQVQIAHPGGALVRTATTLQPGFVYDSADIAADFGAPPDEIDVTVRQLSLAAGWGIPATRRLSLL